MDQHSLAELVTSWATMFWQAKLAGIVTLLSILVYRASIDAIKLAKARSILAPPGCSSQGLLVNSFIEVLVAQYRAGDWLGRLMTIILTLLHLLVIGILLLHTPVFLAIVYPALSGGILPGWIQGWLASFLPQAHTSGVILGITSLMLLAFLAALSILRGRRPTILFVLLGLTLATGLLAFIEPILHIHAILGYILTVYLVVTIPGIHWLRSLVVVFSKLKLAGS